MVARGRGSASCLQRPSWRGARCWASQERSWGHTASSSHSTSPSLSGHVSRGHVSSAHVSLLSSALTVRSSDSNSGRWGGMVTTVTSLCMGATKTPQHSVYPPQHCTAVPALMVFPGRMYVNTSQKYFVMRRCGAV